MKRTLVVSNGTHPIPNGYIDADTFLVVADGGLQRTLTAAVDHIEQLAKLGQAVLVGDLDSAQPDDVKRWVELGGVVEKHPTDKNFTDLELALGRAVDYDATLPITVIGGDGINRFDHLIGELSLLAAQAAQGIRITALYGSALVEVLANGTSVTLTGHPGDVVSLVPYFSAATGVTTQGLRWPLAQAQLELGSSRGISNEFSDGSDGMASVSTLTGPLMVIQPTACSTPRFL